MPAQKTRHFFVHIWLSHSWWTRSTTPSFACAANLGWNGNSDGLRAGAKEDLSPLTCWAQWGNDFLRRGMEKTRSANKIQKGKIIWAPRRVHCCVISGGVKKSQFFLLKYDLVSQCCCHLCHHSGTVAAEVFRQPPLHCLPILKTAFWCLLWAIQLQVQPKKLMEMIVQILVPPNVRKGKSQARCNFPKVSARKWWPNWSQTLRRHC